MCIESCLTGHTAFTSKGPLMTDNVTKIVFNQVNRSVCKVNSGAPCDTILKSRIGSLMWKLVDVSS